MWVFGLSASESAARRRQCRSPSHAFVCIFLDPCSQCQCLLSGRCGINCVSVSLVSLSAFARPGSSMSLASAQFSKKEQHCVRLLLIQEKGAWLATQGQDAATGCRQLWRPERVTLLERRQTAKTSCSLPTHHPGVGVTSLCSKAARCRPSDYFLPYLTKIRY